MSTSDPTTTLGDENLAAGSNREPEAFEQALRTQISMNAEREEMGARHKKARKRMKADGIVLGKLDDTIRKMAWTPQEQREDLAVTLRYYTYAGFSIGAMAVPEGGQVDMFGHTDDEAVSRADWKARGRADALRLKPAVAPKGCPVDRVQDYLEGHAEAKWWSEAPFGHSEVDGDEFSEVEGEEDGEDADA